MRCAAPRPIYLEVRILYCTAWQPSVPQVRPRSRLISPHRSLQTHSILTATAFISPKVVYELSSSDDFTNTIVPVAPDYAPVGLVNGLPLLKHKRYDFSYLTSHPLLHSLNLVTSNILHPERGSRKDLVFQLCLVVILRHPTNPPDGQPSVAAATPRTRPVLQCPRLAADPNITSIA